VLLNSIKTGKVAPTKDANANEQFAKDREELAAALADLKLDPKKMTNAQIRAAIKAEVEKRKTAGVMYDQPRMTGKTVDVDGHALPLNEDGTVTLYHATAPEKAAKIVEEKTLRSAGEPSVYLSTAAQGTGYGDTVVAVDVSPDILSLDDEFPDGRADFRVDQRVLKVSRAQEPSKASGQTYEQPVYHGTPHIFDKFDLSKIGTGEGAQAYGWGLYMAGSKAVAKYYRESLTSGERGGLSLAGVVPSSPDEGLSNRSWSAAKELSELLVSNTKVGQPFGGLDVVGQDRVLSVVSTLLKDRKVFEAVVGLLPVDVVDVLGGEKGATKGGLDNLSVLIDLFPVNADDPVTSRVEAMNVLATAVALAAAKVHTGLARFDVSPGDFRSASGAIGHEVPRSITSKIPQPSEFSKGRLYHVEIPDDGAYLHWDKPLSEQSPEVQAALKKMGVRAPTPPAPPRSPVLASIVRRALKQNDGDPRDIALTVNNDGALYKLASAEAGAKRLEQLDMSPGEWVEKQAKEYLDGLAAEREFTGEKIYKALSERLAKAPPDEMENPDGPRGWGVVVNTRDGKMADDKAASLALREAGIPGIQYLDGGSRGSDKGSHNYVLFDDSLAQIRSYEQSATNVITPDVEKAAVAAYNEGLPSIKDQYYRWASEKQRDGYDTYTLKDLEDMFGDEAPPEAVEIAREHGSVVSVRESESADPEYYVPEDAPSLDEHMEMVVREQDGVLPADDLSDIKYTERLAVYDAFKVVAESLGWTLKGRDSKYFHVAKDIPGSASGLPITPTRRAPATPSTARPKSTSTLPRKTG
jgi:hypothetical protein